MLQRIAFVLALGFAAACGGKSKTGGGGTSDTASPPVVELGNPASETIGGFTLNDPAAKVEAALGAPTEKSAVEEWAATGDRVSTWTWAGKGVSLNMDEGGAGFTVLSITITPPSTLTTSRGIGIGATFAEVDKVYGEFKGKWVEDGEEQQWDLENGITVGSIYGGTMFNFTDGKVSSIFVGAGAE